MIIDFFLFFIFLVFRTSRHRSLQYCELPKPRISHNFHGRNLSEFAIRIVVKPLSVCLLILNRD